MDCVEEISVPGNKIALKWGGIRILYEIVRFFFPSRAAHSVHRMCQHVEDVVLCKARPEFVTFSCCRHLLVHRMCQACKKMKPGKSMCGCKGVTCSVDICVAAWRLSMCPLLRLLSVHDSYLLLFYCSSLLLAACLLHSMMQSCCQSWPVDSRVLTMRSRWHIKIARLSCFLTPWERLADRMCWSIIETDCRW